MKIFYLSFGIYPQVVIHHTEEVQKGKIPENLRVQAQRCFSDTCYMIIYSLSCKQTIFGGALLESLTQKLLFKSVIFIVFFI